jgi:nucleoid DNA-binding protein
LDTIGEAISQEDNLVFVGFGTFKTTISKAKKVRTPRGIMVDVPEKRIVKFASGTELKAKANTKK